ncbi:MAG: biotin/lipoyl-binding protein, partial [Pseudomonadota bacterium]
MKRRIPIIVVAVAIIALLVWLFVIRPNGPDSALVASGTVEATEARLGFQAAGRIESILVAEGDAADSGNVLAQLDRTEALARRDQAIAQIAAAQALLSELESGFRPEEVAQARAAKRAADEQLRDAERDLDRTKTLFEGGAVSQEIYDKARTRYDIAETQSAQAME